MSNKDFLSVSDAIDFTGKAESTIRRVIKEAKGEPNANDILIKEHFKHGDRYWIKKSYLSNRFGLADKTSNDRSPKNTAPEENELVKQLRSEILFLRQQITLKDQRDERLQKQLAFLIEKLGTQVQKDLKVKKLK